VTGLLRLLAGLVVVVAVFVGGVLVGGHPRESGLLDLPDAARNFLLGSSGESLPDQVLEVIESDYYRDIDPGQLQRRSVEEMVKLLHDPYTYYLTPEDLSAFRAGLDGSYFGVGLQVAQRNGDVVVTGVFDKSPAERAGIRTGDRIVSVDGTPTAGRPLDVTVTRIKGPRGTTVRLGLARAGRPGTFEKELVREKIKIPVVASRLERRAGRTVAYVRLSQFTRGATQSLKDAVRAKVEQGARAIVFDLRGDPGGLVDEAVGVASVFLRKDTPVVRTQKRHGRPATLSTRGGAVSTTAPMVVLVDQGSASASEIVAGALRDAGRARLVGTHTFGKALVQTTIPLRDGGALKLTTATYLTPNGTNLARRGLQPDVRAVDRPATAKDEALERALSVAASAVAQDNG
jgi:carboxyl-terminal processing protease